MAVESRHQDDEFINKIDEVYKEKEKEILEF